MFSYANKVGQPKPTTFQPTTIPKSDIMFKPQKRPAGNFQYIAIVETDETEINIPPSDDEISPEFIKLYDQQEIYAPVGQIQADLDDSGSNPKDIYSLGGDPIKTFYVGSITVLGLFILYKILTKTK
jgi:hypothetical protein